MLTAHVKPRVARQVGCTRGRCSEFGGDTYCCGTTTIHETPKRSWSMPKLGEKKVLVSGIVTLPPSLSPLNSRSASAALAAFRASEKPSKFVFPAHWPSDAITWVSPILKHECMIFSPEPGGIMLWSGASLKRIMALTSAPSLLL